MSGGRARTVLLGTGRRVDGLDLLKRLHCIVKRGNRKGLE